MTNKELEAKVINAQSAVAKREDVLAKHREQLAKLIAKGADQYDIRYKEDDIKTATGKLEDARRILKNWQDKLGAQISRDAFIEANAPQVIKDFLERWKQMKSFRIDDTEATAPDRVQTCAMDASKRKRSRKDVQRRLNHMEDTIAAIQAIVEEAKQWN